MKNIHLPIFVILLTVFTLGSCKEKETETAKFSKDASYALGMAFASDIKKNIDSIGIPPDYDQFMKGFKDMLTDKNMRFDLYEAMELLENAFNTIMEEKNSGLAQTETAFLAENSKKPGIIITSSGLQYEVIKEGTGRKPTADSTVIVHYTGALIDGSVFDTSHDRGEPTEFELSQNIITGWKEGMQLMSIGSNYIFYIPSELGYGPDGLVAPWDGTQIIPPYAVLIFNVELIDIK